MAAREPKSKSTILIEVVGRPGGRKGRLELTTGNITYFRQGAQTGTLRLTYQQLLKVLERESEYSSLDVKKIKLPKPHESGDFRLDVCELNDIGEPEYLFDAASSLNKLDQRRVDLGTYQFSHDMVTTKPRKRYQWYAHVSIQAALWILLRYIDKFLVSKIMSDYTDEDVVISKKKMRDVLLMLLKKVDS